ncbi:hypothetical protein ACFQ6S_15935 [Streptomyces sp. NPDC056479]|uniref:hypothetical protein n=1 Tax=Streptomyces sp. NPDC056479 TaxID=3345832 RepID=UPI0036966873
MKQELNKRQIAVLHWVGQGCPSGVWETSTYKITCVALQNRGLLTISKRRGQWNTTLTESGQHYLTHGTYPAMQPRTSEIGRPRAARNPDPGKPETHGTPTEPTSRTTPLLPPEAPPKRTTLTDQLLEELAENNGCIIKTNTGGPNAVNWSARVNAARKSGKIPKTKELYGFRSSKGYEIRLVDIPAWRLADLTPVPVPARIRQPHAVVRDLQSQSQPMGLTKDIQGRSLRLIQALITATETRGYVAKIGATRGAPPPHRRRSAPPHFTITAQGQPVGFLVLQEQDRSEHTPTEKEIAEAKKHTWVRIPRFDYNPSDRLRFILRGGNPHRATEWADTPGRPLEDQLAEIAQEVVLRGEAAERKRLADLEAARQRRLRWEAAMQQARIDYAEAFRVKRLEAQAEAWRHATRLAEYVAAVRAQVEALPAGQERARAEAWLEFADVHLERLNPLSTTPQLPDVPEPRPDDLRPFLRHWSPHGPNSY